MTTVVDQVKPWLMPNSTLPPPPTPTTAPQINR